MTKAHIYTVQFIRHDDDELEQGRTVSELVKQFQDELQEAFDCGHLAGSFQITEFEVAKDDSRVPRSYDTMTPNYVSRPDPYKNTGKPVFGTSNRKLRPIPTNAENPDIWDGVES